jgi:hypothetical protein
MHGAPFPKLNIRVRRDSLANVIDFSGLGFQDSPTKQDFGRI